MSLQNYLNLHNYVPHYSYTEFLILVWANDDLVPHPRKGPPRPCIPRVSPTVAFPSGNAAPFLSPSAWLRLASYPGSKGEGKGEPGINCMRMRLISPDSGENRIATFHILSVYLTFNPGKRSAELQKGPNNERFSGNEWAVFVIQWLTEHSWPHLMFFTAQRSRRISLILIGCPMRLAWIRKTTLDNTIEQNSIAVEIQR